MDNYHHFLKSVYFFETLSESDILKISDVCREEIYEAGAVIFVEGSIGDRCFIILEGSVEIWKDFQSPECDLLTVYSSHQLFGELALIDHFPRSATVLARTPARLLSIHRDDFNAVISESAGISSSIMKSVSAMIRESTDNFIRELRQRNKRVEKAYEQLKKETEERKKLEKQLLQARKMESIGTLAGGIAHDFNNILFPIMGYTEMTMKDLPKGSTARNNLEEILKAANRAKNLVRQILTFSRQSRQERKPLLVGPVIKETVKLLQASFPAKIQVRRILSEDRKYVIADPVQIHQVIMNLCTNAFHALEEKGGILTIRMHPCTMDKKNQEAFPDIPTGSYLKITISDTGCGMKAEVMDKIFEPYFTTKEIGKGTGLGLSIVHGIIKAHKGHITVNSQVGKGSDFHIWFPVHEDCPPIHVYDSDSPVLTGNERILLVDDEFQISRMLQVMLEELGYHVSPRTSSVEALNAFLAGPEKFDLLITDLNMPNMNGDELAEKVLKIRENFPIILCTGFSEILPESKMKRIGIRRSIMKPVVRKEMACVIREVLDNDEW